ncbi:PilZ domain-containing protein [Novosphingobium album (ex Hu et al. 2023)]|uniref:PilZ domain-containing protein n=1 Tax=Novosphingobium album (ex Hu et al. 2023) TaxID=2930093 RepID=A0ABT0AW19_9SPHN|nr:PilZ domain-containing protein [Novosphingobium album (ex Hu et al. 2023)]MCJ2177008.1 PilZ domain-containing protein [Novosphingobium album (ex Hu et al. 2023)]
MNAPIGRLYSAKQDTFDDRRRERRHTTHFEAMLETSQGRRHPVLLADISHHGCCVQSNGDGLRQGAFVSIGLCDNSMLPAIIRWVRGQAAGMEFLRAVPADQTEWLDLMDLGLDG